MRVDEIQKIKVITAMVTPFNEKNEIDYKVLSQNIEFQINNGVKGLLILGSTGEGWSLSPIEREEIIKYALAQISQRVCLFVGCAHSSTSQTIELTKQAKDLGAHCALISAPFYNCPSQEGLYKHFEKVATSTNFPICLYNIPKRCGVSIDVDTIQKLSELKNIIGVKHSSSDLAALIKLIELKRAFQSSFSVWCGDDPMLLPAMSLGAVGVFSVLSNIYPQKVASIAELCWKNQYDEAKELFYSLTPLLETLFKETNPCGIKFAMSLLHSQSPRVRLPLTQLKEENKQKIQAHLFPKKLGALLDV